MSKFFQSLSKLLNGLLTDINNKLNEASKIKEMGLKELIAYNKEKFENGGEDAKSSSSSVSSSNSSSEESHSQPSANSSIEVNKANMNNNNTISQLTLPKLTNNFSSIDKKFVAPLLLKNQKTFSNPALNPSVNIINKKTDTKNNQNYNTITHGSTHDSKKKEMRLSKSKIFSTLMKQSQSNERNQNSNIASSNSKEKGEKSGNESKENNNQNLKKNCNSYKVKKIPKRINILNFVKTNENENNAYSPLKLDLNKKSKKLKFYDTYRKKDSNGEENINNKVEKLYTEGNKIQSLNSKLKII